MSFTYFFTLFFKWANFLSAITGMLGTVMLGISAKNIPWGIRLPREQWHPFRIIATVTNGSNQSTTNRQEWWGYYLKIYGWILLVICFFLQSFGSWPQVNSQCVKYWFNAWIPLPMMY